MMMGRIGGGELIQNLQTADARFRHTAEDDALGRLYRGYENGPTIANVQFALIQHGRQN